MVAKTHSFKFDFSGPGILNINLDDPLAYRDISILDMTTTVLNALGIEPGRYMRGRILEEIYGPQSDGMTGNIYDDVYINDL